MTNRLPLSILFILLSLCAYAQRWEELNRQVITHYNSGNYQQAIFFAEKALQQAETEFGKDHENYGTSLNNLAQLYNSMGDYDKALPLLLQALENTEKALGKDHPDNGTRLNNLALLYNSMGDYGKALPLYLQALENTEKALGKDHPDNGTCLNNLALLYNSMGDYDKALPLLLQALENTEKALGKDHPEYGTRLNNLALLYNSMGDYDKALPLFLEAVENFYGQLEQAFSFMAEKEKEAFVKTVSYNFEANQSFFTLYYPHQPAVAAHAYNIELATKGMILQSGIQTRQAIMNSGDSILIVRYEEWAMLRTLLSKQYSLPLMERRSDLRHMEEEAEKAEAALNRLSVEFSQAKSLANIQWQDIKKELKSDEVAIEFSTFRFRNDKEWTDSTLYIALVLRPDQPTPRLVPLFEQRQLDSLLAMRSERDEGFVASLYRGATPLVLGGAQTNNYGQRLYELAWKPLEEYVPEGSTVYFAPSGSMHQLAFAAIPAREDQLLSDRYQLRQLSSTAMLTRKEKQMELPTTRIALFGGIPYETDEPALLAASHSIKAGSGIARSLPDVLVRGNENWDNLEGTQKEVQAIDSIAQGYSIKPSTYTGIKAMEEQVKALSGVQSPEVLHIASHGFFFPDPQKEYRDRFQSPEQTNIFKISDNPLQRSGLVFAGANRAWQGEPITEGLDDGILTAYEISHMYFGNTKLVVLSACETGLGDIKGSEGVFGLQRAFKQAGVEYLMMSLWKVPDAETAEFMEIFYSLFLSGDIVYASFRKTQQLMKHHYPNDPYKWAGFVLIN